MTCVVRVHFTFTYLLYELNAVVSQVIYLISHFLANNVCPSLHVDGVLVLTMLTQPSSLSCLYELIRVLSMQAVVLFFWIHLIAI